MPPIRTSRSSEWNTSNVLAADQDPGRAPVEQPAGRLPGVGRRRAGHPGEDREGRRTSPRRRPPGIKAIGGQGAGWTVDGKRVRVPYSVGIVGFWYRPDLFSRPASPPHRPPGRSSSPSASSRPRASRPSRWAARTSGRTPSTGATSPEVTARRRRSAGGGQEHRLHRPLLPQGGPGHPVAPQRQAVPARLPGNLRPAGPDQLGGPGRERQGGHGAAGSLERGVIGGLTPDKKVPSDTRWFGFPPSRAAGAPRFLRRR